jgi:hypothetical protein
MTPAATDDSPPSPYVQLEARALRLTVRLRAGLAHNEDDWDKIPDTMKKFYIRLAERQASLERLA